MLPTPQDEVDSKILASLNDGDVHRIYVMGDNEHCAFMYTIGMTYLHAKPELLVTGLSPENANVLLDEATEFVINNDTIELGAINTDVLTEDEPVVFKGITPTVAASNLTYAQWINEKGFDSLQVVWADLSRVFPWEADYDHSFPQEILCELD